LLAIGASGLGVSALIGLAVFGFDATPIGWSALSDLLTMPGLVRSLLTTISVALVSTAAAVVVTLAILGGRHLPRWLAPIAPLLVAVPHLSMAVALAFLLSPSGWLVRLLSPWLIGLERPPVGLGGEFAASLQLTFGLFVKEVPFLLLVGISQLRQVDEAGLVRLGRSLGYDRREAWLKLVLPALYRRLGPAVLAVLAFAVANVEMALPLGPTNPPTWAVLALDLLKDPDLDRARLGALAAILLVLTALVTILAWHWLEAIVRIAGRRWAVRGAGSRLAAFSRLVGKIGALSLLLASALGLAVLLLWSIAGPWHFPAALPARIEVDRMLGRLGDLLAPAWTTAWLAGLTTLLALAIAVLWLEYRRTSRLPNWLYLPLIVPQIAILAGLNFAFLMAGFGISPAGVVAAHLIFVLPYVVLLLGDSFAGLDPRLARAARSLGHRRLAVLWRVKLPLLRPAVAAAAAIGFSVSVALYLPTIFAGGGRVATLATELIALAHGGDRRMLATAGLILTLMPLAALALAARLGRPPWQNGG